jgi:hypothetical protein
MRVPGPPVFVHVLDQGDLPDGGGRSAVPDAGEPASNSFVGVTSAADDDGPPVEAPEITRIGEGIMKANAVPVADAHADVTSPETAMSALGVARHGHLPRPPTGACLGEGPDLARVRPAP